MSTCDVDVRTHANHKRKFYSIISTLIKLSEFITKVCKVICVVFATKSELPRQKIKSLHCGPRLGFP